MQRNILDLKMGDGSYVIEDHDYGNPLMFVHEHTKDLSDKEFYQWISELFFFRLTDEKGFLFKAFRKEDPKMVQNDFLKQLGILAYMLYANYYNKECVENCDVKTLYDEGNKAVSKRLEQIEKDGGRVTEPFWF